MLKTIGLVWAGACAGTVLSLYIAPRAVMAGELMAGGAWVVLRVAWILQESSTIDIEE